MPSTRKLPFEPICPPIPTENSSLWGDFRLWPRKDVFTPGTEAPKRSSACFEGNWFGAVMP